MMRKAEEMRALRERLRAEEAGFGRERYGRPVDGDPAQRRYDEHEDALRDALLSAAQHAGCAANVAAGLREYDDENEMAEARALAGRPLPHADGEAECLVDADGVTCIGCEAMIGQPCPECGGVRYRRDPLALRFLAATHWLAEAGDAFRGQGAVAYTGDSFCVTYEVRGDAHKAAEAREWAWSRGGWAFDSLATTTIPGSHGFIPCARLTWKEGA